MSKSTFQIAPTKVLVGDASAGTITGAGTTANPYVISTGGRVINFTVEDVEFISENPVCTGDGTPTVITVTFTQFAEACDCPRDISIRVVRRHGKNWKISNAFPQVRFYKATAKQGEDLTDTSTFNALVGKLRDVINADPHSPVVATGSTNQIVLTAKEAGIHSVSAVTPNAASISITSGSDSTLTKDDLLVLFPVQPHTFGSRPVTALCSDCMCFYTLKLRKNNGHDPIEGGGEATVNEYHFYVNCSQGGSGAVPDSDWDTDWSAIYNAVNP